MKLKMIPLTLAGVISMQSIAMAQVNRTEGIGEVQIAMAKMNLKVIKNQLLTLDQALVAAKENIEKRDSKGNILSGSSVAGAALGLGLVAYSAFAIHGRNGSADGIMSFLAASAGMLMTASSAGLSVAGQAVKPEKVDIVDLNNKLTGAEKEVASALVLTNDKSTTALLNQLNASLKSVRSTLNSYSENDDSISKNKLRSQIAQAAGVALTIYGVTQRDSKAVLIGPLVMSAGNIGQIIGGLSSSEADLIIKEIENTRRSLMSAAVTLE